MGHMSLMAHIATSKHERCHLKQHCQEIVAKHDMSDGEPDMCHPLMAAGYICICLSTGAVLCDRAKWDATAQHVASPAAVVLKQLPLPEYVQCDDACLLLDKRLQMKLGTCSGICWFGVACSGGVPAEHRQPRQQQHTRPLPGNWLHGRRREAQLLQVREVLQSACKLRGPEALSHLQILHCIWFHVFCLWSSSRCCPCIASAVLFKFQAAVSLVEKAIQQPTTQPEWELVMHCSWQDTWSPNLRGWSLAARYLSHFRAIHRGAYFAQLRTTTVRKLLPESWGFLCPVHTPDGAPCGLLSHLTATCRIVAASPDSPEDVQHSVTAVSARLHANAPRKVQLNLGCQGWVSREKPTGNLCRVSAADSSWLCPATRVLVHQNRVHHNVVTTCMCGCREVVIPLFEQ